MGASQGSVFDMSLKRDKRNINKRDGLLATKTGVFQKQFNFESVKNNMATTSMNSWINFSRSTYHQVTML